MLTPTLIREYRRERKIGQRPAYALISARTRLQWRKAELCGLVRLRVALDDSGTDPLDGWEPGGSESAVARAYAEERERITRDGVTGIIGEYRVSLGDGCDYSEDCCRRMWDGEKCEHWGHVDSCWGFIGDDWKGSGYDMDIMRATIRAAAAHIRMSSPYLAI